jgi:hypothetical protein
MATQRQPYTSAGIADDGDQFLNSLSVSNGNHSCSPFREPRNIGTLGLTSGLFPFRLRP